MTLVDEASGKAGLLKKYDDQNAFFLEPVHGEDILEEAIEKLEPMFQRRVRAVEVNSLITDKVIFKKELITFSVFHRPVGYCKKS